MTYTLEEKIFHMEEWLRELRSGNRKQASGVLHSVKAGSFCCLGVACDMAAASGVVTSKVIKHTEYDDVMLYGEGEDETAMHTGSVLVLPEVVRNWLGLPNEDGHYVKGGVYYSLAEQNDQGFTFEEIADIAEREFLTPLKKELAAQNA